MSNLHRRAVARFLCQAAAAFVVTMVALALDPVHETFNEPHSYEKTPAVLALPSDGRITIYTKSTKWCVEVEAYDASTNVVRIVQGDELKENAEVEMTSQEIVAKLNTMGLDMTGAEILVALKRAVLKVAIDKL